MKRGALHDPDSPRLDAALDYASIRVGVAEPTDWFQKWNCPADGDMLGNDALSCCVPVADFRLIQLWLAARGIAWRVPLELVKLRYRATGGWQDTPATDNGTLTQEDAFAWQAAPITARGEAFDVAWASVAPGDVVPALRRGPLLLTLGLTAEDADDPDLWQHDPAGPLIEYHRVLAGATDSGLLGCRTYGFDRWVSAKRVVAADLMIHVNGPVSLREAGLDWSRLGTSTTG